MSEGEGRPDESRCGSPEWDQDEGRKMNCRKTLAGCTPQSIRAAAGGRRRAERGGGQQQVAEAELALCKGVRCFGEGRSDVGDRPGADGERIWEKKLCKIISHNRSCRGWRWRRRDGIITSSSFSKTLQICLLWQFVPRKKCRAYPLHCKVIEKPGKLQCAVFAFP